METQKVLVYRRKVKHPRIELKTGNAVLILPKDKNIKADLIIEKHRLWISKKLKFINEVKKNFKNKKLILRKENDFITIATGLIDKYCHKLKVQPRTIKFRYMKTKWGSCSKKGRISLNKLLKFIPDSVMGYVVYHELCHLIVPKHNSHFWLLVEKEFPAYKNNEQNLFGYWFLLNEKLNIINFKNSLNQF